MNIRLCRSVLWLVPALAASLPGTALAQATDSVVIQWDNAALQAIRDTRPAAPIAARALAITHTCMYDAWAAYDPAALATRLGATLRRPAAEQTPANKQEAISFAAYRALVDLFPQAGEVSQFQTLMRQLGYDPGDLSTSTTLPDGIGNVAAQAVLQFRHQDGANQLGDLHPGPYSDYTGYAPVNSPGQIVNPDLWQPLLVPSGQGGSVAQQFDVPQWGMVTPFALSAGSQFRPPTGPARFGSLAYDLQAQLILGYSLSLTDQEKTIAEYWADGPGSASPAGHWCLMAQLISRQNHYLLDDDVKLFFALTNALFDASIACWDAKRAYDSVRPISAVRLLFAGEKIRVWAGPKLGVQWIRGEDWQPYQPAMQPTPASPEYVSGHSAFAAAAAEILKRFTGSDAFGASYTAPAGSSSIEPGTTPAAGTTLSWSTFSEAADEAGLAQRYGGVAFADGDLAGRAMGRLVGAQAWAKALAYFAVPAP